MQKSLSSEFKRLRDLFQIKSIDSISEKGTCIVPVNITYYPIRARENILSNLADYLVEDIPKPLIEEIMTEGSMLLSGVDVDIRFGKAIEIKPYLSAAAVHQDISTKTEINFDDPIPSKKRMRRISLAIIQRYKSAIYSMTTVNHDLLFASLLRSTPYKKHDSYDLRQEVSPG